MAKRMKKWIATLLVLSMCISVVALPAGADASESEAPPTVTVDITDADGNVIGQKSTTTTTTSNETPGTYTQNTDTQSSWSTQQTEGSSNDPVVAGNTTVTENNQVVTEVTGTEQKTDNISSDKTTGVQTYSGSVNGNETTTITDTTTKTTTTTDALQSDKTVTSNPYTDKEEEEEWSGLQPTGQGQWQSTGTEGDGYVQDGKKTTTNHGQTAVDVDKDPLDKTDVTLQMDAPTGDQTVDKDAKTLFISIEDALANDISYKDGEVLQDGSVVKYTYNGKNEVIGYTITKHTPTGGTNNSDPVAGTPGKEQKSGSEVKIYTKPAGYTPVTDAPIVDSNGKQIGTKTIEEILDAENNVIGYTITETVVTNPGNLPVQSTENLTVPKPHRTLPTRPVAPEPVTQNGLTTTTVVEDILDGTEVIGYKTTVTVTDEDGNEVSSESESIFGTVTSYSSSLTKTPERDEVTTTTVTTVYGTLTTQNYTITTPGTVNNVNTRDVSQEIYELVKTDNGLYFLFEGKMYKVQAITGADQTYQHGSVEMETLEPNIDSLEPGTKDGTVSSSTLLRNPENFNLSESMAGIGAGYELEYVGYGLETAIMVNKNYKTNAGHVLAHQFKLKDRDGNYHYVLCADLGTNAVRGADYNMTNVGSANYYVRDGAAEKIEVIAINGYWGTDSGTGSLDHVKSVLRSWLEANTQLTEDQINAQVNALKPGEALTATQAAIWYYGNSDEGKNMPGDAVTGAVYNSNGSTRSATAGEAQRVNNLYQALLALDPSKATNNTTELLNTTNFATETELVIKEKATENGAVKTDADGNEKYITDLTFSLDVRKSDLTGNLIVKVTDENGNVLRTEQIATDSSNLVGKLLANGSRSSTEHTYTIRDLELAEGVKINLNLSGTQNLAEGAYLYSAAVYSTSQTFIGVASGTQEVNLNVQMEFSVTDPQAKVKHTTEKWSEKEETEESFVKVDNYKREKKGTVSSQTVSVNTKIYGTNVQEDVTEQKTVKHRSWRSSYLYSLLLVNDEGGGGDDDRTEIDDEEVPLAKAPKTGDITAVLAAVSLFSAGGLVTLNRKKKEEE